jgi:hypothetical protein
MELTVRLRPQSYQVPRYADPPQRRRQVAEALLFLSPVGGTLDSPAALWIQLVLGIGLFVLSFRFDPKRRKNPAEPRGGATVRHRIPRQPHG